MKTQTFTIDDLPYQGRKLLYRFDARQRRAILDSMSENMQRAGCAHLQLGFLTAAIQGFEEEQRKGIPDGADQHLARRCLDQVRHGDYMTSEQYIAELGGL